jgi:hypothetical protein
MEGFTSFRSYLPMVVGVAYVEEIKELFLQIKMMEKLKIYRYAFLNFALPLGNKMTR